MRDGMRFSVITVTRNSEAVLARAMASLQEQTFADFEWIVVDGASQDGTVAVARRFAAAPLQLVSESDSGIYDAMNKGVRLARGEYLYFLNSDDTLADPAVLERANEAIEATGQPELLIGRVRAVGARQTLLRDYSHINARNLLFDSLCHQATFARRDTFDRFGLFDTRYRLAADFDWFARVLRGGAVAAFTSLTIADFSTQGAHAKAADITRAETRRIRRAHAGRLERAWSYALAWTRHKGRRVLGLQAKGRLALIEPTK